MEIAVRWTSHGEPVKSLDNEKRCWKWLTWCSDVSPSTLAVLISAPRPSSQVTSFVSALEQAARNTQLSLNLTADSWRSRGVELALFVSDVFQHRSCSSRRHSAFFDSTSSSITCRSTSRYPRRRHRYWQTRPAAIFVTPAENEMRKRPNSTRPILRRTSTTNNFTPATERRLMSRVVYILPRCT